VPIVILASSLTLTVILLLPLRDDTEFYV